MDELGLNDVELMQREYESGVLSLKVTPGKGDERNVLKRNRSETECGDGDLTDPKKFKDGVKLGIESEILEPQKRKEIKDLDLNDVELTQREYENEPLRLKIPVETVKEPITKHNINESEYNFLQPFQLEEPEKPSPKVLKRIPPGRFISVTSQTNNRVYLRMTGTRNEFFDDQRKLGGTLGLLSRTFWEVRNQAEDLLRKSQREAALGQQNYGGESSSSSPHLWVDQFKPKTYLELLSDDGVNRTLLRWFRLWDKIVFGVQGSIKPTAPSKHQAGMIKKNWPQVNQELDSSSCPVQRLALLCGPPGFGKTTLALVIAKHAGYNLVEMNASDDRSVELFRTQIEAATQMRSVVDRRPNCLVIDEIDGAPAASINLLIAMTTASTRDKKKKGNEIRRPIICICNDQYSPAFKLLRQQALVLVFPPTVSSRLAYRLQEIATMQQMNIELTTLLVLCDKTGNDIRSCLSTLQFINNNLPQRRNNHISLNEIISYSVGQKDVQRSFFGVWLEVFTIPRNRGSANQSRDEFHNLTDKSSLSARFHHILKVVTSGGDVDKLYAGLFHNYLNLKSKETRMDPTTEASDWLCFVDQLQHEVHQSQNYILYPYTTLGFVVFHLLFATLNKPKIEYPTRHFEVTTKLNRNLMVRDLVLQQMKPSIRTFVTSSVLLLDVLPYLSIIFRPNLRPVNTQLYSASERKEVTSLIDLMISYRFTYIQERTIDGQYNYVLQPNIDDVVYFGDNKQPRVLTYAAKQVIAREIELENVRKHEAVVSSSPSTRESSKPEPPTKSQPINEQRATKLAERAMVDFFGRTLTKGCEGGQGVRMEKSSCDLWFHFKEGYSNASDCGYFYILLAFVVKIKMGFVCIFKK